MLTIDFYFYSLHEVIVWAPIWRALRAKGVDARFVLEPPGIHTAMGSMPDKSRGYLDDKKQNLVPLMTPSLHAEIRRFLTMRLIPYSLSRNRRADAVVTTQGTSWISRYKGLKFRTQYGVGAVTNSYGHGAVNAGMDAVFAHGEFSRSEIARVVGSDSVFVTGFPKYARFFRGEFDRAAWRRRMGVDDSRPVLVYLSTWAHNSSIDRYGESIARLADRYQILYKPHHNNLHLEDERIDVLRRARGVIVNDSVRSIVPFYVAADAVLADVRSGALTEAFLTDRPVIGLSPHGDRAQDALMPGIEDAAPLCTDPASLSDLVPELLGSDRWGAGRAHFSRYMFAALGGRDDSVTADAMIALARGAAVPAGTTH